MIILMALFACGKPEINTVRELLSSNKEADNSSLVDIDKGKYGAVLPDSGTGKGKLLMDTAREYYHATIDFLGDHKCAIVICVVFCCIGVRRLYFAFGAE